MSCSEVKKTENTPKPKITQKIEKPKESVIWGEPENGLILGIEAKKSEWKTDETAEFTVYLKNVGKEEVYIPMFFFGLSALELKVVNDKEESINFMKVQLSHHLGDPLLLKPNQILSATQTVGLNEKEWEGSTGKYQVTAIYDTTNFKDDKLWKERCTSGTFGFIVK